MNSPVDVRVNAAESTPSGYIVRSGVQAFRDSLRGPQAAAAFDDWRNERFTKMLFLALQDMILHQPREVQSDSVLVQLGMTQGLALAAQLVADPSVLWPGVFGETLDAPDSQRPPVFVKEDYGTKIDDVIGAQ